jgi:hypothetical protein
MQESDDVNVAGVGVASAAVRAGGCGKCCGSGRWLLWGDVARAWASERENFRVNGDFEACRSQQRRRLGVCK